MQLGGKQGRAGDVRRLLWRFLHTTFLVSRGYVSVHTVLLLTRWVTALQQDYVVARIIARCLR